MHSSFVVIFQSAVLKVHPLSSDGYVKVVGFENECSNSCIGFQDLESVCSYSQVCHSLKEKCGSLLEMALWFGRLSDDHILS